jgi:hypothetical protein
MMAAIIDEGRRVFVINLRLHAVNLRCSGRQCHKGATLSDVELWGMFARGGWSRGRRWAWLSSLCRSWVLVACIIGVVIIIGVRGIVGVADDLCIRALVPSLPRSRLAVQRRVG